MIAPREQPAVSAAKPPVVSTVERPAARFEFPAGICLKCGYDLRSIESLRCPECGKPFVRKIVRGPLLKRTLRPARSLGRAAIPIAIIVLLCDAALLHTPLALLLLAVSWLVLSGHYLLRDRRRQKRLILWNQRRIFIDPDIKTRNRISTIFLATGLIVWSGVLPRLSIAITLPWLDAYAENTFVNESMLDPNPHPGPWSWHGVLPIRAQCYFAAGVSFQAGFGCLDYAPKKYPPWAYNYDDSESDSKVTQKWYLVDRPWSVCNPIDCLYPRVYR